MQRNCHDMSDLRFIITLMIKNMTYVQVLTATIAIHCSKLKGKIMMLGKPGVNRQTTKERTMDEWMASLIKHNASPIISGRGIP